MIAALESLAGQPGVELAMLSTVDGVPIASQGIRSDGSQLPHGGAELTAANDDALAAMALSWLGELESSSSPLGWGDAGRMLLRCARGSLVMQRCRGAVLVVLLAPGVSSEELRLSMTSTVSRIERGNRNTVLGESPAQPNPPAPMPSKAGIEQEFKLSESTKPHQEKA